MADCPALVHKYVVWQATSSYVPQDFHPAFCQFLPLVMSWQPYDNTGAVYKVHRILNEDGTFNLERYKAYSPLFLSCVPLVGCAWLLAVTPAPSTSFAISYGLSFASITATIVHSILYFWKPIRIHLRRSLREQPDIHAKLMSNYRQVPEWWYAVLFAINFAFACLSVQLWPTHLPIWALVIGLLIGGLYSGRITIHQSRLTPRLAMVYIVPVGKGRTPHLIFLTSFQG